MITWIFEAGESPIHSPGGSRELRTGWLVNALVDSGHSVTWWTSTFDHGTKTQKFDVTTNQIVSERLRIIYVWAPPYTKNVSLARYKNHKALADSTQRLVLEETSLPDIILCAYPIPEIADRVCAFAQERKIPVLIDVLDLWPDIYLNAFPSLKSLCRLALFREQRLANRVMNRATGILAVSQAYLNWATAKAQRPQATFDGVFPLGYSTATRDTAGGGNRTMIRKSLGADDKTMVVVFSGVFGRSYDLDTVIDAAHTLITHVVKVRFILIGSGDKIEHLIRKAKGLSNVVFLGWQSKEKISEILPCCDVGLVSYTRDALQSLPYKPFEYMAMGLPLASSLEGELSSLIDRERIGVRYNSEDSNSLSLALSDLALDSDRRKVMAARSFSLFSRTFDSRIIYPSLVRHMETVNQSCH